MAKQIFTFGYEGLTSDVFIARLEAEGIKRVVDVRANPLSRKRGFSKKALASALSAVGIDYTHLPAFGCPKPVRDRYKRDSNWAAYTRSFLAHLQKEGEAMAQLAKTAKASPSCLICFEADFERCHRTFVARAAAEAGGLSVTHLTEKTAIPDVPVRSAA